MLALPLLTVTPVILNVSVLSRSLSFASRSEAKITIGVSSRPAMAVSLFATGASFVPFTVKVIVPSSL